MSKKPITDHPILFTAEMVRAILDGRKTQTRRVIKPQPASFINGWPYCYRNFDDLHRKKCPYGVPGDLLWVKETWRPHEEFPDAQIPYLYRADYPQGLVVRWRSSRFMPKCACRLWLKIKSVRVERVQDTIHKDMRAEGVEGIPGGPGLQDYHYEKPFRELWDSINAKRGYGWDVNPWVWVVEFERYNE